MQENELCLSVDCKAHGDVDAFCVYGDHCSCSYDAGFMCEGDADASVFRECERDVGCVPQPTEVTEATSDTSDSVRQFCVATTHCKVSVDYDNEESPKTCLLKLFGQQ